MICVCHRSENTEPLFLPRVFFIGAGVAIKKNKRTENWSSDDPGGEDLNDDEQQA